MIDARANSGLDGLLRLAPGTARITTVEVGPQGTGLTLQYPRGLKIMVCVGAVPRTSHYEPPPRLRRLLAGHIRISQGRVDCTLLGTSQTGPRRVRVSIGQALALAESGVHTVVHAD